MVPNGWKISTLAEISKVSSGGTPSRGNIAYWGGDIPWVTTAEVKFNTILDTEERITELGLEESSAKVYPINTILMAMYGQGKTRGQVAMLGIEATTNQACAAIALNENYDPNYYFQFLLSRYKHIRNLSNSGGQQNLSAEIVKSIQVPIPPLIEQKKIAQILSTWDKAITSTEKLLENSQKQKQALMQQLLTGKKRFSGFKDKWLTKSLGEIGEIRSAGVDKNIVRNEKPVRLLNFTDVFNRSFIYSEELNHWVTAPDAKVLSCDVKKGDVFFTPSSETRDEVAIPAVAAEDINDCCYSYHVIRFRLHENWDLNFKAYIFITPEFRKQAYMLADGSGQRYVISQDGFRSIKITYPSYQEQVLIGKAIKAAEDEVNHLKQTISYLKEEKKALMQQLLTGKKRVKLEG